MSLPDSHSPRESNIRLYFGGVAGNPSPWVEDCPLPEGVIEPDFRKIIFLGPPAIEPDHLVEHKASLPDQNPPPRRPPGGGETNASIVRPRAIVFAAPTAHLPARSFLVLPGRL